LFLVLKEEAGKSQEYSSLRKIGKPKNSSIDWGKFSRTVYWNTWRIGEKRLVEASEVGVV